MAFKGPQFGASWRASPVCGEGSGGIEWAISGFFLCGSFAQYGLACRSFEAVPLVDGTNEQRRRSAADVEVRGVAVVQRPNMAICSFQSIGRSALRSDAAFMDVG